MSNRSFVSTRDDPLSIHFDSIIDQAEQTHKGTTDSHSTNSNSSNLSILFCGFRFTKGKYATLTHMINELANTRWSVHILKSWLKVHIELNSNFHPVWLNDTILINKRAFLARFSYMQFIRESNYEPDWSYSWYGFFYFGVFEAKKTYSELKCHTKFVFPTVTSINQFGQLRAKGWILSLSLEICRCYF